MPKPEQKLTYLQLKLRAASTRVTLLLSRRYPDAVPLILVSGYPRSGTVWTSQLASDYLQLPFPRNPLLPIAFPAVIHSHYHLTPTTRQGIYVIRDARDNMVSYYHFLARAIAAGDRPVVPRYLRRFFPNLVNKDDIGRNLAAFIAAEMKSPLLSVGNWPDHVRTFLNLNNPQLTSVQYEKLRADTAGELSRAMAALTGDEVDEQRIAWATQKYSFEQQSKRKPGEENRASHMRKATTGEWRSVFMRDAAQIIDHYCGDLLIELGYEKDRTWVQSCPQEVGCGLAAASPSATLNR